MDNEQKILITGGAGFIGSNLIKYILETKPAWRVVNFDLLTYAGSLESLSEVENHPHYRFVHGDVTDRDAVLAAMDGCWGVMHLAAESHVDRSIIDPGPFLKTNVLGTQIMLDAARMHNIGRFIQVSTDEVYGSLGPDDHPFAESHPLQPNSPYSASKAGADMLARACFKTYDLPVIITRCSNNYGPYQFPEKLLPLMIRNAEAGLKIPVYGDGMQVRDWIYVADHCRALVEVLERGIVGETYNIGGGEEMRNLDLIKLTLRRLGKPESLIAYVKDRPGHDRRYAMDITKIKDQLSWEPVVRFEEGIDKTISWYRTNRDWVESVVSGEYADYYRRQYGF